MPHIRSDQELYCGIDIKFNVGKRVAIMQAEAYRRLSRTLKYLVREIRNAISRPWPPASTPGDFPAMRTGALRESIGYTIRKNGLVYTGYIYHAIRGAREKRGPEIYGPILEGDVSKGGAKSDKRKRPHISVIVQSEKLTINRILTGKISGLGLT